MKLLSRINKLSIFFDRTEIIPKGIILDNQPNTDCRFNPTVCLKKQTIYVEIPKKTVNSEIS